MKQGEQKDKQDILDMICDVFFEAFKLIGFLFSSVLVAIFKKASSKLREGKGGDGLSDESRKIARFHLRKGEGDD